MYSLIHPFMNKRHQRIHILPITIHLLLLLGLLGCEMLTYNATSFAYQQAQQAQQQLNQHVHQAELLGIPTFYWEPLLVQEQQIGDGVWFHLLHHPFPGDVYQQQAAQYHALSTQLASIVQSAIYHLHRQAQQDIQQFQALLTSVSDQGVAGLAPFYQTLQQTHTALPAARSPRDDIAISTTVYNAMTELHLLSSISQQLAITANVIDEISRIPADTASLYTWYQQALQQFNAATRLSELQNLSLQIDAHNQQLQAREVQLFPALSVIILHDLTTRAQLLATYGVQKASYQAHLDAARSNLQQIQTQADKRSFLTNLDADIAALDYPLLQGKARYLLQQFHHEVTTWAQAHLYHDRYDGHDYALDNGYMDAGLGNILDKALKTAQTTDDLTSMVANVQNALFNLHQFERDIQDNTPYTQVHQSDTNIITHYAFQKQQILLVSLAEQAMRVYQDGKLVRAFLVTTGRQELPSIPGTWPVLIRRSPIIFQAGEPKDSPYWFPDTFIHYAMLYHIGGYFVHDAPWRDAFGPGTQFPHYDPIGTNAYNFDGSHGCINLSEDDAAWVYTHTTWNTVIVIY